MPTIPANKIPLIAPGNLFNALTTDTYNVRWLVPEDPVHAEALNRPSGDIVVRQLMLARSLDQVQLRLSHQNLFPFLIQPQVVNGTTITNLPLSWIWDMHVSLPAKWEDVRLARVKRISGSNTAGTGGDEYTGVLRLVFTATQETSATEVAVFQVDYHIDGTTANLSYQRNRISIPTAIEESNPVDAGESETIDGFITFATLDTTDSDVMEFLDTVGPPIDGTDGDSDGEFDSPAVYEIRDADAGGSSVLDDFTLVGMSHGTGIVVDSAFNSLTPLDSDINNFISALNYSQN
jgi:hypothetical protein